MTAQQKHHWRDVAISHSEIITDAWEVTKAYSARLAEWVLFICMIFNIVEILPEVHLPSVVSSAVLATQAVTLDIAGFGLASMADHAKRCGNDAAAQRAGITGYCLISMMLVTLLVVTIGILWPETREIVAVVEKLLILGRVLMTVVYGHVIHSLRVSADRPDTTVDTTVNPPQNTPDNTTTNTTIDGQKAASEPAKNPPQNTTTNTTNEPPKSRQRSRQDVTANTTKGKIAAYRRQHPGAAQSDIARDLNVSLRTVQRHDSKPVEQEQARRIHIVQ